MVDAGERIRITHPFHPRTGEEFERADHQRLWGEDRLYLRLSGEHLTRVPVSWTSLAAPDPWVVLTAGRVRLRVDDMLRLADLLDSIEALRRLR